MVSIWGENVVPNSRSSFFGIAVALADDEDLIEIADDEMERRHRLKTTLLRRLFIVEDLR